jgi:hypothetical protein
MRRLLSALVIGVVALASARSVASAQSLGSFSWQLAPYCNVITVTVTQTGSNYALDGYDNQCGASPRAAVVGMAVPNPTGTVTLGFTIVTPPSGIPVHVQTAIDLGSLGGSWADDQGRTGTFVFTPTGVGSGSPRPAAQVGLPDNAVTAAKILDGAVGASDINQVQVQTRVTGTCPAGQAMRTIGQTGAVTWEPVSGSSAIGNTAMGYHSLFDVSTGSANTAVGYNSLQNVTTGSGNVALGNGAGGQTTTGSNNLYRANPGGAVFENQTIRVGSSVTHTRAFVAGVSGVTTGSASTAAVVIDANGQLGTISSSRKSKFDIADLPGSVGAALQRLRPVQFRYKQLFSDGSLPIQYGLIAEEVEQVLPELVAYDEHDQPMTVKYHVLPGLLLAEVQRLERERVSQGDRITAQSEEIAQLRGAVAQLHGLVDGMARAVGRR